MAATKTQEQLTEVQHIFLPRGSYGSSITALTMKTITTETPTNVQTDSTCTQILTLTHSHIVVSIDTIQEMQHSDNPRLHSGHIDKDINTAVYASEGYFYSLSRYQFRNKIVMAQV